MTESSTPFLDSIATSDAPRDRSIASSLASGATTASLSLDAIPLGEEAVVAELALEPELAAWLRAVGIGEGDRVSVLRSGAFGGPLHVRNSDGGEFALNRQLARSVLVKRQ